jgi:hypothetical protein
MHRMENKIREAIASLRLAKNNMSRNEFLQSVKANTTDADDAEALMLASSQVSYERMQNNAQDIKRQD